MPLDALMIYHKVNNNTSIHIRLSSYLNLYRKKINDTTLLETHKYIDRFAMTTNISNLIIKRKKNINTNTNTNYFVTESTPS